jgi:BolA protein
MADDGFLLIPDNVLGAHAGEEIVRMVVLADMIEAKPPIFALAQPPPWARDGTIFVGLEPDVAFSRPWPALTGRSGSRYADAMARRDLIAEKLTKAFAPASLEVVDESHQHAGHAGHREGGETHFRVYIVAEAFRGKSRLERHRMINETLVGELEGGVHALAIHASAPDEGGA